MAGTKAGGLKAAAKIKAKFGDDFYVRAGQKGGSVKGIAKGFAAMSAEKRVAAGRKGGANSKRGPARASA